MNEVMLFDAIKKVLKNDERLKQKHITTIDITETNNSDLLWRVEDNGIIKNVYIELTLFNQTLNQQNKVLSIIDRIKRDASQENRCLLFVGYEISNELVAFSKKHNIVPIKIIEPTNEDWGERIKEIHINMKLAQPSFNNFKFNFDEKSTKKLLEENNIKEYHFNFSGMTNELVFLDNEGKKVVTLQEILNEYSPDSSYKEEKNHITYKFENDIYWQSDIGLVKINSIEFDREVHVYDHPIIVDANKNRGFAIAFSIIKKIISLDCIPCI